jgi:predicted DNA binding protein
MTKQELEAKLQTLQKLLDEQNASANSYRDQIQELKKQLEDLNKPKLTPLQFDKLRDAIETGVGQFDFDDTDNYSYDFHIDYDNRIAIESFSFDNAYDLGQEIYNAIEELFAEAPAPEDEISIQEHLNQD